MSETPIPKWVPPGMEDHYREWQRQLDDYVDQWGRAVRNFIDEKQATREQKKDH
jgi:hypothetical protein